MKKNAIIQTILHRNKSPINKQKMEVRSMSKTRTNQLGWVLILPLLLIVFADFASAQSPSLVWAVGMGGPIIDQGLGVAVDAAGNVYTTGFFRDTADFDPGVGTTILTSAGSNDVFVQKLAAAVTNQDPDCSIAAIADQSADANCQATISGADVTGVTDPDGDLLTITVSPTTLVLGANTVTVDADDGNGGNCSIDITVNVVGAARARFPAMSLSAATASLAQL
jgi:hypothetical protein